MSSTAPPKTASTLSEQLNQKVRLLDSLQAQLTELSRAKTGHSVAQIQAYVTLRATYAAQSHASLKLSLQVFVPLKPCRATKAVIQEILSADNELVRELFCLRTAGYDAVATGIRTQGVGVELGRAYSIAIDNSLRKRAKVSAPSDCDADLQSFRKRLVEVYHPPSNGEEETASCRLWCPITRQYHPSTDMTPHPLIPCELGAKFAAKILGISPSAAQTTLWSPRNGLLITNTLRPLFAARYLAVVPFSPHSNELRTVVLTTDEQHLNAIICEDDGSGSGKPVLLRDLDNTRLGFLTQARPARQLLYVLALQTTFERRRVRVDGWLADVDRVVAAEYWGPPGSLIPRSSIFSMAKGVDSITNVAEVSDLMKDALEAIGFGKRPRVDSAREGEQAEDPKA